MNNDTRTFPDQQTRVSETMRIARLFDGHYCWNTATSVARLYEPATRWAAIVRWVKAR
jgi:hypothetical protein